MKSFITFMMYIGLMCFTAIAVFGCDDTEECTVECPNCDESELTDEERADLLEQAQAEVNDAGATEEADTATEEDVEPTEEAEEVEETDTAEVPEEPEEDPEELDEDPTDDPSGAMDSDPVIIFIPNGIPPTP